MSKTYVPADLRRRVAEQARHRCGYCSNQEVIVGVPMEVEHIVPEADGGPTTEDNLWLACSRCNEHKSARQAGFDPQTSESARLFDPRHQVWAEHFGWSQDGAEIVGLTPTGRATVAALSLNRAPLVASRRLWVSAGWHPPRDDPPQG